jgi:hypothetical protein
MDKSLVALIDQGLDDCSKPIEIDRLQIYRNNRWVIERGNGEVRQ